MRALALAAALLGSACGSDSETSQETSTCTPPKSPYTCEPTTDPQGCGSYGDDSLTGTYAIGCSYKRDLTSAPKDGSGLAGYECDDCFCWIYCVCDDGSVSGSGVGWLCLL